MPLDIFCCILYFKLFRFIPNMTRNSASCPLDSHGGVYNAHVILTGAEQEQGPMESLSSSFLACMYQLLPHSPSAAYSPQKTHSAYGNAISPLFRLWQFLSNSFFLLCAASLSPASCSQLPPYLFVRLGALVPQTQPGHMLFFFSQVSSLPAQAS